MATVCLTLGLASSILGLACSVLAISSSLWLVIRSPFLQNDVGIMRHCDVTSTYCGDMERLNDLVDVHYAALFRSVQAMYLLHCIGLLVSTIMYILYTIRFFEAKGSFRFLTVYNLFAFACGVYSIVVFGMNYLKFFGLRGDVVEDHADLGRAFYMAIAGCTLSFLVMVFSAMEASQATDILRNMQHRLTVWSTPYTLFVEQEIA